jgi:hypothetical protein
VSVQDKQKSSLKRTIQHLSDTVLESSATPWTELPDYVFEAVVEHLEGDKKESANFRLVCHAWREAHARLVSVLKPNGAPADANVWKTFGGVKTVDLNEFSVEEITMTDGQLRGLAPLTGLTSLNLGSSGLSWGSCVGVTDEGVRALAPLTGLTDLNLGGCDLLTDEGVKALTPLTGLTYLNLGGCDSVTAEGLRALSLLTGLTSLDLCGCDSVTDEGMRALAPLTGLTDLDLGSCYKVTAEGLRALAPLTGLTSLNLSQ